MATAINPTAAASTFFPLPNRQTAASRAARANNTNTVLPAFAFDPLLDLGNSPATSSDIFGISDFIDLSPAAQNFLDFFNGAAGGLTGAVPFNDNGIVLTDVQQAQIDAIILKFKDAPFTADTFAEIKKELAAAGLSPEQLTAQNDASALGLSDIFLRALALQDSGTTSSDLLNFNTTTDADTRAAYNRQIFAEWERLSSTFKPQLLATFIENPFSRRKNNE